MTEVQKLASNITKLYGTIKRARGPYLYTAKRVRLTDLFQEGGRAILGWASSGTSAFTVFKNVLSRGVTGSFDTDFSLNAFGGKTKLDRAVSQLFNSPRVAYILPSKDQALSLALSISQKGTSIYKPWSEQSVNWQDVDCIILQPPLPWASGNYILCVKEDEAQKYNFFDKVVKIASPLEAAIVRSIYDLIKALQNRQEKDWFIWDKVLTKYWIRKGPYLFPKIAENKYEGFVQHCLECGVVISPSYNQPSIVPYGADRGAFSKLEKNEFKC